MINDPSILMGNAKQKPLEYYIDNSNLIMLYLNTFHVHLRTRAANIQLNDNDAIQELVDASKWSDEFKYCLDDFVQYTQFIK